jgi:hypothetical protein
MSFVDVTVIRGAGDIFGEEITDVLFSTDGVAVQRGRNLIDANASARIVSMTTLYRPGLQIGQLVEVHDSSMGAVWRGKITDIGLSVEGIEVTADLQIERPA